MEEDVPERVALEVVRLLPGLEVDRQASTLRASIFYAQKLATRRAEASSLSKMIVVAGD
jgi:hypothetical protein